MWKCRKSDGKLMIVKGNYIARDIGVINREEQVANLHKSSVNYRKHIENMLVSNPHWVSVKYQKKLDLSQFLDKTVCGIFSKDLLDGQKGNINFVSSHMGIGKTEQMISYMQNNIGLYLSITYRCSMAIDQVNKFRNAGISVIDYQSSDFNEVGYNTVLERATGSVVIVIQFESLHRLSNFDHLPSVIILDEYVSLIEQIGADLQIAHKVKNLAMMRSLIRGANQAICLDANMNGQHVDQIDRFITANDDGEELIMCGRCAMGQIDNSCITCMKVPSSSNDSYKWSCRLLLCDEVYHKQKRVHIIDNITNTLDRLIQDNKKIVVVSNSSSGLVASYDRIIKQYPHLRVLLVTGDNTKKYQGQLWNNGKMKQIVYQDVSKYLVDNQIDVFMYSPTIQAGLSIVLEQFDDVVASFCDMTCSALACVQMLGRVRSATNIHLCIMDSISKQLYEER